MNERRLNGSNIVAIVSILVAAISANYSSWNANKAAIEIESIKFEYERKASLLVYQMNAKKSRCEAITSTAASLAKAQADFLKEFKNDSRSKIDEYIWAGITHVTGEKQQQLLTFFADGPEQSDKYEVTFTTRLAKMTLMHLAREAIECSASEKT